MRPEAQRRLEASLHDDGYTCETFCNDIPYTIWNTCPLCLCGLMPVVIVCFSAVFRLDYARHVTDIGAEIINEIGLSYTVYYTAGCWPREEPSVSPSTTLPGGETPDLSGPPCNTEHFEIAAGEFDALSGSLLKMRNVTNLHARRVDAVKVTPDWRYIVFVGALAMDIGNLYAVGAEQQQAEQAVALLSEKQLDMLDEQCQRYSEDVRRAAGVSGSHLPPLHRPPIARLAGFKQLQVIIPGIAPIEHGGDLDSPTMPRPTPSTSLAYRAAFAFECSEPSAMDLRGGPSGVPLRFSKLAVVDFQLHDLNVTSELNPRRSRAYAKAELRLVEGIAVPPLGASEAVVDVVDRLKSQSCPRFVPSKMGHELLFVAEDPAPARPAPTTSPSWLPPQLLPSRWLALTQVPGSARGPQQLPAHVAAPHPRKLRDRHADDGGHSEAEESTTVASTSSTPRTTTTAATTTTLAPTTTTAAPTTTTTARPTVTTTRATTATSTSTTTTRRPGSGAILLAMGEEAMPRAPVHGCPEFVPSLYLTTQSLTQTFSDKLFKRSEAHAEAELAADRKLRDTFVILSDPASASVVGVDAQVLAVSLAEGQTTGAVSRVHLLYNVDDAPANANSMPVPGLHQLRLSGCQPIRAAGRKGHMRLQWVLETLMTTLQLPTEQSGYTAWLACLTADQRIAIVESPKRDHWINMSMPFPLWTGRPSQDVWCPPGREEACFEVWSNPNPNE